MSGSPDPKPERRVVDRTATRRTLLRYRACLACGASAGNGHHVLPVGRGQSGDDVVANIVALCGTGAMRCHGAFHGSPYLHHVAGHLVLGDVFYERRDGEWVARRIGERLDAERPDVVQYVLDKIGRDAGLEFLRRRYHYKENT